MTTKGSAKNWPGGKLPFVVRGLSRETAGQQAFRDIPTTEEPLPPALETDQANHLLARYTRITKVQQETTDDN
ncbi:MAG: hypothetical protein LAO21_00020 [Acidobacteriia bacterium]|nr:hypothetical protein [Terriglobia bacterium]